MHIINVYTLAIEIQNIGHMASVHSTIRVVYKLLQRIQNGVLIH